MSKFDTDYLRSQIIGVDSNIETPFGSRLLTYADYTASGRGLQFVENYLLDLEQIYANSHTEDDASGRVTTGLLHQAEEMIKRRLNASEQGVIIPCGTGATGAIDRMQQIIGLKMPATVRLTLNNLLHTYFGSEAVSDFEAFAETHQPVVFVGPYEHHSNEISWREGLCSVIEVQLTASGEIDLDHLETLLQDECYRNRLRIGSFSAASNVTGMKTPVHEIATLLHRYGAFAFFDYAASAPYVAIDMNPEQNPDAALDAVFISPHKFLGGPGASGILVFNSRCYHENLAPSIAGGGTVDYVGPDDHDFIPDIEQRESAGTPGILQTLRAAMAFEVKHRVGVEQIERRELAMTTEAITRWQQHPAIEILGNPDPAKRIGIISFNIKADGKRYLHPRFVTTLLNDLFGIQTRAGCSCAGPYGHRLLGIDRAQAEDYRAWINKGYSGIKPGWCRLGFHYVFDQIEFEFILKAVEFVADHGKTFTRLYSFDQISGRWSHQAFDHTPRELALDHALDLSSSVAPVLDQEARQQHYRDYFTEAQGWLSRLGTEQVAESNHGPDLTDIFLLPDKHG